MDQTKSRLPAGSMLEIAPGVRVPHPEAEVNLPGAGDPRTDITDAVLEHYVTVVEPIDPDAETPVATVTIGTLAQRPLDDSVKPKALTVSPTATPLTNQ